MDSIEKTETFRKASISPSGNPPEGRGRIPIKNRLSFDPPTLQRLGGGNDPLRNAAGARKFRAPAPKGAREQTLQQQTPKGNTQVKRGPEHVPSSQRLQPKKLKTTVSKTGQVEKAIRVGILPKDYPKAILGAEQLQSLEDILVEEICQSKEKGVHFKGYYLCRGMMLVDCGSPGSAGWLMQSVANLSSWTGPELVALSGDDIPKPTKITVLFPRSQDMDNDKILQLVEIQNSKLNTGIWRILRFRKERTGTRLMIEIDHQSEEFLKTEGCQLNFRFGRIPVSGLRKHDAPAEGFGDVEMPSTSQEPGVQREGEGSDMGQPGGCFESAWTSREADISSAHRGDWCSYSNSGEQTTHMEFEGYRRL